MELREQTADVGEARRHDVVDAGAVVPRQVLREPGNRESRLPPDLTGIGHHFAVHDLEQRRLAGAIAADQADALTCIDLEARLLEQGVPAERNGDAIEAEKRHGAGSIDPARGLTYWFLAETTGSGPERRRTTPDRAASSRERSAR